MSICVRCPVCNEIYDNEILYYDHVTEKIDDRHVIYKKQLNDLIEENLDRDMSRREILRLLTKGGYIVTENEIFDIESKHYPNKGIYNFYGIPYREYGDFLVNESVYRSHLDDTFPKIFKILDSFLYNDYREGILTELVDENNNPTNLLVSYMLNPIDKFNIICTNYYRTAQVITKEFKFDSCHNLLGYEGKCKYPHGHTYILKVSIKNKPSLMNSMVMDFGILNKVVKEKVIDKLDHKNLNEILNGLNTTAEDIILWIWKNLDYRSTYNGLYGLYKLELWETPTSKVELTNKQMMEDTIYLLSLYQLYNTKI